MLSSGTAPFVDRSGVRPTFLPDGRFWYRVMTATGSEYVIVDPSDGSRKSAAKLAEHVIGGAGAGCGAFPAGERMGEQGIEVRGCCCTRRR